MHKEGGGGGTSSPGLELKKEGLGRYITTALAKSHNCLNLGRLRRAAVTDIEAQRGLPGRRAAVWPGWGIRPRRPVRERAQDRAPALPQSVGISTKLVQLHRASRTSPASEGSEASDGSEASAGPDDSESATGDGGCRDAAQPPPPPPLPSFSPARDGVECRERAESQLLPTSQPPPTDGEAVPNSGVTRRDLSRSYIPRCSAPTDAVSDGPDCLCGALAGGWLGRRVAAASPPSPVS